MATTLEIEQDIQGLLATVRPSLIGKEAVLTKAGDPKHHGRLGKITDVSLGGCGNILALFYVYRKGNVEFLNGDGWTRQYRPLNHLDLNAKIA